MILGRELVPNISVLLAMFKILHSWRDHFQKENEKEADPVLPGAIKREAGKWMQNGIFSYSGYF